MIELLAEVAGHSRLWYAVPLIVSVSLVYGATRDELIGPILNHSLRAAIWIVGFMSIIFTILFVISWAV
jgi:hypothetical protein